MYLGKACSLGESSGSGGCEIATAPGTAFGRPGTGETKGCGKGAVPIMCLYIV